MPIQDRSSADDEVYARTPLCVRRDIPVFSEPSAYIENYEQIARDHLAETAKSGRNPFVPEALWVEQENAIAGLVARYSQPGQRVLDVGVGLGRLLARFPLLDRRGLDISLDYLEQARNRGIKVCLSLVEEMPFKDGTFDLVVASHVLEHVLDLNLSVRRMLAALKPDGVLIVQVPYREDLTPYTDPSVPYRFVHLRSFDTASLRLLFERVFDCACSDWLLVGHHLHVPSRLKYRLPGGERWVMRGLRVIGKMSPGLHRWLMQRLVLPIAITVVVRKRS
jgi:SAM-dependent methyltransferase